MVLLLFKRMVFIYGMLLFSNSICPYTDYSKTDNKFHPFFSPPQFCPVSLPESKKRRNRKSAQRVGQSIFYHMLFNRKSILCWLLLLPATGSYAQYADVNAAGTYVLGQINRNIVAHTETNNLPADPNLYLINAATDSVEVGLLVSNNNAVHYNHYLSKRKPDGCIRLARCIWVFTVADMAALKAGINPAPVPGSRWVRLCRFLGLSDDAAQRRDTVVFLKVAAADMFRPAYQTDITRHVGQAVGSTGLGTTGDPVIDNFLRWEQQNNTYPWTRLGYTFDWGAPAGNGNFGVTEFIVKQNNDIRYRGYRLVEDFMR